MDYGSIPVFQGMARKMHYLGERQALLAMNVANVDTPDYTPRDLKKPDFAGEVQAASARLSMARTHASHLAGAEGSGGMFKEMKRSDTFETNPNENKVSLEEEMQKMALNQADYNQMTALYRKTIDMFKTAIGRPGSV